MATLCVLDNNHQIVQYHAAAELGRRPYFKQVFQYIGDGQIHSVDGIMQTGNTRLSFFVLRPDRPRWAR